MEKTNRVKKGRRVALLSGVTLVVLLLSPLAFWNWAELRTWYVLRPDFESLGRNAQGYPEYRHRQSGIVFVRLPGGQFDMGSPDSESDRSPAEGPVHKVTLSPFLIAKYEVSQAEWKLVMRKDSFRRRGDTIPIEHVSWENCEDFCMKSGLSLPTEAQWEYACRGGTTTPYAGTGQLHDMAWYENNSEYRLHPVGEKQPNHFGLHDMHGNVREWCADSLDGLFYSKPEATQRDPLCTTRSDYRVIRGGGIWDVSKCRSAYRSGSRPDSRGRAMGFRPAAPSP